MENEFELRKVNSDLYPSKLSRAEYYFNMGVAYKNSQQYQQAAENLRLVLLHDPEYSAAHFELATIHVKEKRWAMAVDQIDLYITRQWPNEAELDFITNVYLLSGSIDKAVAFQDKAFLKYGTAVHLWKKYQILSEAKDFGRLGPVVKELESVEIDQFLLNTARAEVAIQMQRPSEAADHLEIADRLRPNQENNLRWRIRLNVEAASFERAVRLSKRYQRYHDYNLEVSELLTIAATETKQYEIALAELAKQKKLVPWNTSLDYQIAYTYFLKQDYNRSENLYADIFSTTDSEESLFYLMQIELAQDNPSAAKKLAGQMATWSDYYPMVQLQIARMDWQNGKKDLALNRVRIAHRQRPDSLELVQEYSQFLIWSQNYVEAIALIEKGKKNFSEDLNLRMLASYVHFTLENQPKFLEEITYVIERDPNNAEIYAMLTQLYYKKKRMPEQIEYLAKKALELKSAELDVKPILAWALLKQDKFTESIKYLEELYDENPKEIFFAKALTDLYHRNSLDLKTKEMSSRTQTLVMEETFKSKGAYVDRLRQKVKLSALPLVFATKKKIDFNAPIPESNLRQILDPREPAPRLPASLESAPAETIQK